MQERIYFHSPFSRKNVGKHPYPYLLLSFILSEFFNCCKASSDTWFFPTQMHFTSFVPASDSAPFNKLQEHVDLLSFAFPQKALAANAFKNELFFLMHFLEEHSQETALDKLKGLFSLFIPFIEEGTKSETFLFFLLKHQKEISLLTSPLYLVELLERLHVDGLQGVETLLCDYFHKKGFPYLIQEIKHLFQNVMQGSFL